MVQLWLLETEQGNLVMLHPFYAIEQEVDTTVQRILAAHPDESFRKVRRMERGFTIHFTYLPSTLPDEDSTK